MSQIAELLVPAIRWDPANGGFEHESDRVSRALEIGVGGFILLGGSEADVRTLTKDLRQRSRVPLLIGAELERGAGQQFEGTTGLPPLAALASLNDIDVLRRAAKLTAREARTIGVNWNFAPVCDLDLVVEDVLRSSRALGADPTVVGRLAAAWIEACQHEGVLACARHFPGLGRLDGGSRLASAVIDVPRRVLLEQDVVPFKAAIAAQAASIMTAHVAYAALDASRSPATMSTQVLRYLLREKLGFDGLIASDWSAMGNAGSAEEEAEAAVRALDAGCDLLLCPEHLSEVVRALDDALRDGPLDDDRIIQSRRRRSKWAQWAAPPTEYRRASGSDLQWAATLNERVVHPVRGQRPTLGPVVDIIVVDDSPPRPNLPAWSPTPFVDALRAGALRVQVTETPSPAFRGAVIVALFGGGQDGDVGYSASAQDTVARACAAARQADRAAAVVQFNHPRLADGVADQESLICAWSEDRWMQEAAARWLLKKS
jgi:beta-glucosidase-like glycosyl hydrolase